MENFWGRRTEETEKSNCNQDCPGTLLVTLGVFIHIQSLHLVFSKNSMCCWLVWTKRATICFVEIGCLLVCLVLIFGVNWCLRKYITLCLNVITFCFSTESFCIFSSVLSPWINTWSGGYLCLLTNILCSFLLRVLLHFILFYLFYIPFPTRCSNPCLCIWVRIGERRKCRYEGWDV